MGYHSKTRILLRGHDDAIESVVSEIESLASLRHIGDHITPPEEMWKFILEPMKKYSSEGETVIMSDSPWFKAAGEWDEIVDALMALSVKHGVDYSYARIGENDDDFEHNTNTMYGWIQLERKFDTPDHYAEIIDAID
tara:strand:+ start:16361 stop:16774 length:414 start_codon:yes stop_codon:yes gene_type:complete